MFPITRVHMLLLYLSHHVYTVIGTPTNEFNRTQCPPGEGLENTTTDTCEVCPLGQYSDTFTDAPCIFCPSGSFQNQTRGTRCYVVLQDCNTSATGATNEEEAREHCAASNLWGWEAILAVVCVALMVGACLVGCCCYLCH